MIMKLLFKCMKMCLIYQLSMYFFLQHEIILSVNNLSLLMLVYWFVSFVGCSIVANASFSSGNSSNTSSRLQHYVLFFGCSYILLHYICLYIWLNLIQLRVSLCTLLFSLVTVRPTALNFDHWVWTMMIWRLLLDLGILGQSFVWIINNEKLILLKSISIQVSIVPVQLWTVY